MSSKLDLVFDELSHGSLPQLRRAALCDVERRCDHLAGGSVQADEVDEAGEILQVREINWVKINTLRITVCFIGVCMLLKYAYTSRNIINSHTQHGITGSRVNTVRGYDTMVMFLLLFTNRKSFQSISFSLGETERMSEKEQREKENNT